MANKRTSRTQRRTTLATARIPTQNNRTSTGRMTPTCKARAPDHKPTLIKTKATALTSATAEGMVDQGTAVQATISTGLATPTIYSKVMPINTSTSEDARV